MTAQENVALVRSLLEPFNSHQSDPAWLDKIAASISEDCELFDVLTGQTFKGPEGYKQLNLLFAEAFPGSSIEIRNAFATEDQAVVEYTGRGTHTGSLRLPTGEVPATGRRLEMQYCDIIGIRNGKVVNIRSYHNVHDVMQQLGLTPSKGEVSS